MHRRAIALATPILVGGLVLAACGSDDESGAEGETQASESGYEEGPLVIGASSADVNALIRPGVEREFKAATGADITWIDGGGAPNLQKLIASKGAEPPFDVAQLDNVTQVQAIGAGVISEFDRSTLSVQDNIFPSEGYGPGWLVIREGTCVNTEAFDENGVELPTGVDSWFDPQIGPNFTMPDIGTLHNTVILPALADHFDVAYDQPELFMERMKDADVGTFWTSSADAQTSIQSGAMWAGALLDGRCIGLKLDGAPVDFLPMNVDIDGQEYPYVGIVNTWDIVTGTDKPNLASKFIDIIVGPEGTEPLLPEFGYLPAREDLLEAALADEELSRYIGEYSPEETYYPDYAAFLPHHREWTDVWNETFKN